MQTSAARGRWRRRELAVLAAGVAAGAALLWAGATVHSSLRSAGEVAVARLAATAADTVVAEWERMLRAEEPPVAAAGETFRWTTDEPAWPANDFSIELGSLGPPTSYSSVSELPDGELVVSSESAVGAAAESSGELTVMMTLLREAERRELVEQDLEGALALVLEALEKNPWLRRSELHVGDQRVTPGLADGDYDTGRWITVRLRLRALQLAARLGKEDVVRRNWEAFRHPESFARPAYQFERILAWLALPAEMRSLEPSSTIVSGDYLETLFYREDRIVLGPPDAPDGRFELAPMLVVLLERLGLDPPPLAHRKLAALRRVADLPMRNVLEGRWLATELAGRQFLFRRDGEEFAGFFYGTEELKDALRRGAALPPGFVLDLDGDDEALGVAVRPRTPLPGSPHAFTLRHADPESVARGEASRLRVLRGALVALALACAGGGWLAARVLARERRLGELKSAFVAGVSHDLRTPLASILLLAENLESGAAEQSGRARYHVALRKEAARLRRRIDDVLDFSRLERGEGARLEREELALAPFVSELAAESRARVEAAEREFALERGELAESGSLDPHALRRALENLVDNALKHGAGAVRLSASSRDGRLVLAISDEGPGVPASERERVFEPFERLALNGHAGGTGLGLAIVRAIARAHGGDARVRANEDGRGATFELELALVETEERAA